MLSCFFLLQVWQDCWSIQCKLLSWKRNIPNEKTITEMVETTHRQLALQSLALSSSQLCYWEPLGLYPFWMNGSEICFLWNSPGRLKTKHYEIRHYRRNVARTLSNHSQFLPAHFEEIIKHKSRRASCRMLQKFHYEIKAKMQVHWNKNASLSLNYLHLIEVSTYSYDLKAARLRPNSFQLSSGRRVSQGVIWPKSVHYFVN